MKLKTFWADKVNENDGTISIDGGEFLHITKVFRLKIADSFLCLTSGDYIYTVVIESITKQNLTAKIIDKSPCEANPNVDLTIFQGNLKSGNMEDLIKPLTEIGASSFVPLLSQNVIKTGELKKERTKQIAIEAAKQCGRTQLLDVKQPIKFNEMLKTFAEFDHIFIAHELETTNLKTVLNEIKEQKNIDEKLKIALIIGPEGGLTNEEVLAAINSGCKAFCLNKRILRAETACLGISNMLLFHFNEFEKA
jgi:16S rRNA (uracil1498-N3)-methyltransferase